jgi:uncharacterized protein YkwD
MIGWVMVAMLALAPVEVEIDSALEADVLAELNRARADPQGYANDLRDYRRGFDGLVAYSRETPDGIMTKEGAAAVDEAIAFLDRQPPLPPLSATGLLARGAGDLVADQGPSGRIGHISSIGFDPSDRVKRHGGGAYVAEVITYGPPDPRSVVRQLIVDDGVARRGHRALVFSGVYHFAGVACGPHATYGAMCVVDMSASPDGRPVVPRESSTPIAALVEGEGER